MEEREERAARNESMFRQVNERLLDLNGASEPLTGDWTVVCECADVTCIVQIALMPTEYQAMRAVPTRFAVAPGHVYPDVERVVLEGTRFTVVEKLADVAPIAEHTDPRS